MTLAALLLLAGVVSYFLAQQAESRHDALQAIADQAAAYVDEVSRYSGEFAARMSLGPGGTLELPDRAAGYPYALTLYRSYIVAGLDGDRAFAILRDPIHLWQPAAGNHTSGEVDRQDSLHPSLSMESGGSVVVSRRALTVDGAQTYGTFAFP